MPLGKDQQYDLSWAEQDKVRRRNELKNRLKLEAVRKKFDPYLQMKDVAFTDPSVDRYADLRKKGRMPGSPLRPSVFFGMIAATFIPMYLLKIAVDSDREPFLEKCRTGEITYEERQAKAIV